MINKNFMNKFSQLPKMNTISSKQNKVEATSVEKKEESVNTTEVINRLKMGDLSALEDLKKAGIGYSTEKSPYGTQYEFEYNGKEYSIFIAGANEPATKTETKSQSGAEPEAVEKQIVSKSEEVDTTEQAAEIVGEQNLIKRDENGKPIFDYSVISDPNKNLSGVRNEISVESDEDCTITNMSKLVAIYKEIASNPVFSSPAKLIDSGYYDSDFDELSKLKPQLKQYLKEKMKETGAELDDETCERYINQFISQALDNPNTKTTLEEVMSRPKTIADAVDKIVDLIDKNCKGQVGANFYTGTPKTLSVKTTLTTTANYFLTSEERDMKELLISIENQTAITCKSQEEADKYIETAKKYLVKEYKAKYPNLSEEFIASQIDFRFKDYSRTRKLNFDNDTSNNVTNYIKNFISEVEYFYNSEPMDELQDKMSQFDNLMKNLVQRASNSMNKR